MTEEEQQAIELERLVSQAESEEPLQGEFQPNNKASPHQGNISTADLMTLMVKAGFNLVASFRGDHWKVTDEAATEAGAEFGAAIDYYFPDVQAAPWVGAGIAGASLLVPRVMIDNQIREQREKAERDNTATEKGVDDGD